MRTCNEYANGVKRATGWTFAHMLNFYFGEMTIILVGEGSNGKDIQFAATNHWLNANHATKFGLTKEDSPIFTEHVSKCQSPECQEAHGRLRAILPFFQEGRLPGSPELALASVFESKRIGEVFKIQRSRGGGRAIDEIKPFIEWFTEDKDFWIWP